MNKIGVIGISGMMHGYLPFDQKGNQIANFRTWQNTTTEIAAKELTEFFHYNIPQRWSIAHLYQAILNEEEHVIKLSYFTTLAGYVHWKLTGEKVLGIGDASGMFPIDSQINDYNHKMVQQFNHLIKEKNYSWEVSNVLPQVLVAGEHAGNLTEKGARLIDPTGTLEAGISFAAPEGDAGTGMVATNSVGKKTGNISAGTSIFSMVVLEEELSDVHIEIDPVTTPAGDPVAMIHCNNFTSDINAWVSLLAEVGSAMGVKFDKGKLFKVLFESTNDADEDLGKLISSNYYTGEPITGFTDGRPLFVRTPDSRLTLPNFMKTHIYSSLATLRLGMDILYKQENVELDYIVGHGGFFKTKKIGQQLLADAINVPISVMESAGEGGPWGMAILADYMINNYENKDLTDYLAENVFIKEKSTTLEPREEGVKNYNQYMVKYQHMLNIQRSAIENLI